MDAPITTCQLLAATYFWMQIPEYGDMAGVNSSPLAVSRSRLQALPGESISLVVFHGIQTETPHRKAYQAVELPAKLTSFIRKTDTESQIRFPDVSELQRNPNFIKYRDMVGTRSHRAANPPADRVHRWELERLLPQRIGRRLIHFTPVWDKLT